MTGSPKADFGSASFEPSDEQLQELAKEAFADVAAKNQAALAAFRATIAKLRREVVAGAERGMPPSSSRT